MDKTLNELVENVSKSKSLANDIYLRTISRQGVNCAYEAVKSDCERVKPHSKEITDPVCKRTPKPFKADEAMKCRFDKTFQHLTEHMSNFSKECQCFYKSCPKRSLSRAEKQHINAYHSRKARKSPEKPTKKDVSKSSSSGNKSDSSSPNSLLTQSDLERTHRKIKFKEGQEGIGFRSKDSLKLYNRNTSHLRAETELESEWFSQPYRGTDLGAYAKPVTFSRWPSATNAHTFKHPTVSVAASLSDESTSTEASNDGTNILWLHTRLLKEMTRKSSEESHGMKHRNSSLPQKSTCDKTAPKKAMASASLGPQFTHLGGQGFQIEPWAGPAVNTAATKQGICILTKPGQYIVRKPVEGSGKKLFHVKPGQFISLNLSDLDTR